MLYRFRRALVVMPVVAFLLIVLSAHAKPRLNNGVPWRIAYYEGGPWVDYQGELIALIDGLTEMGWVEPVSWPSLSDQDDVAFLWDWIAENVQSEYVHFLQDAFWSSGWDSDMRQENRDDALWRLSTVADIDLMLALGTWSGLDLANNEHSVPTLVMSTNNPIQAGLIASAYDSGFDHVHARTDPDRCLQQITVFHNMLGFKKLGIIYDDTPEGRTYAALDAAELVADRLGFELVTCLAPDSDVALQEAIDGAMACLARIAPEIDAFLITSHLALTAEYLPGVLSSLFEHNVASWAFKGPDLVKRGALMSIQRASYEAIGRWQAENVDRILNGTLPRDLNQVFEEPKSIVLNFELARLINFDIPPGLLAVADKVYDEIEGQNP